MRPDTKINDKQAEEFTASLNRQILMLLEADRIKNLPRGTQHQVFSNLLRPRLQKRN
jgi:hypothetical protein